MSRTDHRRNATPASTSRLTPPGPTTPTPSRVPPNAGQGHLGRKWDSNSDRHEARVMKRHGRRVERRRGKVHP